MLTTGADEEEPQGLAALLPGRRREKRVNIKERMASILMQASMVGWAAEYGVRDNVRNNCCIFVNFAGSGGCLGGGEHG